MKAKVKDFKAYLESMKSNSNTKSYDELDLDNPEKADLDQDGKLSDYEYKRAKSIEKSESESEEERDCE